MNGFAEEPRVTYSAKMGRAEFFAWLQTREGGRYELKDGEIVVHPGASRNHARVTGQFAFQFRSKLPREDWEITVGDFAVEIGDDIRYPDGLVERRADDGQAYGTIAPMFLVEVVSPTSAGRDLTVKANEYTSLPSLQAYIVASQDQPVMWFWQRDAGTGAFSELPIEIEGAERSIDIAALRISLPLIEIYRGIAGS